MLQTVRTSQQAVARHSHAARRTRIKASFPMRDNAALPARLGSVKLLPKAVATASLHRYYVCCATEPDTVELEIKVDGMACGGCSSKVEDALKKLEHVKGVEVSLDSKLACVEVEAISYIDAMNMLPEMIETIKELGFEAEPHIEYEFGEAV